ncbi:ankyrin repeat domain-containing protein 39 [Phlebotomus argentipes]|uniref:ankyrin repeat domain-containing protein 39 n=1 Tax=Phlebotomus argentipes TaxID=94469 RepID=UPI002892AF87|nr:ankyrin repeat domain-containing protein 39 [Phlebotomus argentipes]
MTDHHLHGGSDDDGVCHCRPGAAAQTLNEMDFERGIWTAALYDDLDRLDVAIKRGATNDRDNSGYTALHYAARAGHLEACRRLLSAGADANCTTNGGVTPLQRAAMMGRLEIVKFLCEKGAVAETRDSDGQNALHRAAQGGHKDVAVYLMGRNPRLKNTQDHRSRFPSDLVAKDENLRRLLAPDSQCE